MKYYKVEPTYKKSVIEWTMFKRLDENGKPIFLRKELGWRWGEWLFTIPDTEEEQLEFAKNKGYDSVETMMEDEYGYAPEEEMSLKDVLLPSEDDTFVDITEDYYDSAEMLSTWDGCWEYWSVESYLVELTDEEKEAWVEEAEEAYNEDYEEGVEELGWEFTDTCYEIHCNVSITECDEHGNELNDEV